jgi:hypothetical protein
MPKRKKSFLSPSNAMRLVEMLIEEGKVLAQDIARYLHIANLEARLAKLRGNEVRVRRSKNSSKAKSPKSSKSPKTSKRAKPAKRAKRPKRRISAKGRRSYQLQGRYIAFIRRFPKNARGKYQKIAKEQGRERAIAVMKRDLAA